MLIKIRDNDETRRICGAGVICEQNFFYTNKKST